MGRPGGGEGPKNAPLPGAEAALEADPVGEETLDNGSGEGVRQDDLHLFKVL